MMVMMVLILTGTTGFTQGLVQQTVDFLHCLHRLINVVGDFVLPFPAGDFRPLRTVILMAGVMLNPVGQQHSQFFHFFHCLDLCKEFSLNISRKLDDDSLYILTYHAIGFFLEGRMDEQLPMRKR